MLNHATRLSWWNQALIGLLAIAFGISAVVLPTGIMFGRILGVISRVAEPLSGSMAAVASLLVGLIAVDGLVNLFGMDVVDKRTARVRGIIGVVTATAVWPGKTAPTCLNCA
ncbi:MAG TPA: hypothetical protein VEI49_00895 [Terriglobales bacterium]|nr:hypothetical protein [Terriglobales bacterium]